MLSAITLGNMRIAYLDCFSGISGDMFLGAILDAGVSPQIFHDAIASLDLEARLEIRPVMRSGISATKSDVIGPDGPDLPIEEFLKQPGARPHEHSHTHHENATDEAGRHDHPQIHSHSHGRGLAQIRAIIARAAISESAKATAIRIFETLGAAEAKIHNQPIEQVHFHEVGAVDALADIVCAAVGSEALGVDEFYCSPLNVGGGTVQCAHGTLPLPAPATVEILRGVPIYSAGPPKELVTPTGAAIVRVLVHEFSAMPAMQVERAGYGAGSRDLPGHPNVLRITVGEATSSGLTNSTFPQDQVTILEANLDDLSPQIIGYVIEKALEQGALDAFALPIQMKKSRPAVLFTLITKPEDAERFATLLLAETSTLGVRRRDEQRYVLPRRWQEVSTPWGTIRIKIAELDGRIVNAAPEFEDCRKLAEQHNVPLKQVMQAALAAWEIQKT